MRAIRAKENSCKVSPSCCFLEKKACCTVMYDWVQHCYGIWSSFLHLLLDQTQIGLPWQVVGTPTSLSLLCILSYQLLPTATNCSATAALACAGWGSINGAEEAGAATLGPDCKASLSWHSRSLSAWSHNTRSLSCRNTSYIYNTNLPEAEFGALRLRLVWQ